MSASVGPAVSKRLERIIGMIRPGDLLADIGTDHAFVPIAAVSQGLCKRALACDIVPGPLVHAGENIAAAGLSALIDVRQGDGLLALRDDRPDIIVITGMGGPLMERILREGFDKIADGVQLILSPQSELAEFRLYLAGSGFGIRREAMVEEDGKFYLILDCFRESRKPDKAEEKCREGRYGDPSLYTKQDLPIRERYIRKELRTAQDILKQLKGNDSPAAETRRSELKALIEEAERALSEQGTSQKGRIIDEE